MRIQAGSIGNASGIEIGRGKGEIRRLRSAQDRDYDQRGTRRGWLEDESVIVFEGLRALPPGSGIQILGPPCSRDLKNIPVDRFDCRQESLRWVIRELEMTVDALSLRWQIPPSSHTSGAVDPQGDLDKEWANSSWKESEHGVNQRKKFMYPVINLNQN